VSDIQHVIQAPIQSKWGYHFCDLKTYRSLKRLNKLWMNLRHRAAAKNRYDRKTVNKGVLWQRVVDRATGHTTGWKQILGGVKPTAMPDFVPINFRNKQVKAVNPNGQVTTHSVRKPTIGGDWIADLVRQAHTPSAAPVPVPVELSTALQLLADLEAWYAAQLISVR
jgi:hypothetical protein